MRRRRERSSRSFTEPYSHVHSRPRRYRAPPVWNWYRQLPRRRYRTPGRGQRLSFGL